MSHSASAVRRRVLRNDALVKSGLTTVNGWCIISLCSTPVPIILTYHSVLYDRRLFFICTLQPHLKQTVRERMGALVTKLSKCWEGRTEIALALSSPYVEIPQNWFILLFIFCLIRTDIYVVLLGTNTKNQVLHYSICTTNNLSILYVGEYNYYSGVYLFCLSIYLLV